MKKLLKFYLLSFILLSDFTVFAQAEPPDEPEPAPLNSKIILLAIAGVCFVIYTFRKNKRTV